MRGLFAAAIGPIYCRSIQSGGAAVPDQCLADFAGHCVRLLAFLPDCDL